MDLENNKTDKNENLKKYTLLQKVWEANASESSGKILTQAQVYIKDLPSLLGTGPFTAVILDLKTSEFRGCIGNFEEICGIVYHDGMSITELVPLIYPTHNTFSAEHFLTYLNYIIPRSLEERNQIDLSVICKYLRGDKYYWISIRAVKYFSDAADNLGYVILEYTDITNVKTDNQAKFVVYDRQNGYIINETLHPNCSKLDCLTPTELSITKLISQGLSDKEIAEVQSCAVGTIKQHKKHIFLKLHINKSTELVGLAYDCGLIS